MWMTAYDQAYYRRGTLYTPNQYLWLHLVPDTDFQRGGAFLFGTSKMVNCFDEQALAPELARVVHNFGCLGADCGESIQFAHFIIDSNHLASIAPKKTIVVLELSYIDLVHPKADGDMFNSSVIDTGLYSYAPDRGLDRLLMLTPESFFITEHNRIQSFARRLPGVFKSFLLYLPVNVQRHLMYLPGIDSNPRRLAHTFVAFHENVLDRMDDEWEAVLPREVTEVTSFVDQMDASDITVVGFLPPEGSWARGLAAQESFEKQMRNLFSSRRLQLLDATNSVPDEEFTDPYHLNPSGTQRVQRILIDALTPLLREHGDIN